MRPRQGLLAALDAHHASENTKEHAMYAYFFLNFTLARVAKLYRKGEATVSRWVDQYTTTGVLARRESIQERSKFPEEQRQWILRYVLDSPLSFLVEIRQAFILQWTTFISTSSVWRIMQGFKLSHKVVFHIAHVFPPTIITKSL